MSDSPISSEEEALKLQRVHYRSVFQDYYKALEDADEKVQLANQIYDLVSISLSEITIIYLLMCHVGDYI